MWKFPHFRHISTVLWNFSIFYILLATVSAGELVKLTKIKKIIRKGRLKSVTRTRLVFLTGEEVELLDNTLVVDCAVNSIKFKPKIEIFSGEKITLQANIKSIISFIENILIVRDNGRNV